MLAAPAPPQPINTYTNTNNDNKDKVKADRPLLPVPSHGTRGVKGRGGEADGGAVLEEVDEARGNMQSLRWKVQRWDAKLARCRELGDVSGGIVAGDKVLQRKCRLKEG